MSWRDVAGQARRFKAVLGTARRGRQGKEVEVILARQGAVRQVWQGEFRHGEVMRGLARQAWQGDIRQGRNGRVVARRVEVWLAWLGKRKGGKRMVYQWRYSMKVPAQKAGQEIERIEKKYGAATPENVLEESRKENSVLHPLFEWDDEKAAEKYRLHQASVIICNLRVTEEGKKEAPAVRAFVNVSEEKKGSFMSVMKALEMKQTREVVLRRALMELREFEQKYKDLQELSDVIAAIEKVA